jgi:hypothetical protein
MGAAKPFHSRVRRETSNQRADSLALAWKHKSRHDLLQRLQHEASLVSPRVWQGESFRGPLHAAERNEIQVQGTRLVQDLLLPPPKFDLQGLESLKQRLWGLPASHPKRHHGIDERR